MISNCWWKLIQSCQITFIRTHNEKKLIPWRKKILAHIFLSNLMRRVRGRCLSSLLSLSHTREYKPASYRNALVQQLSSELVNINNRIKCIIWDWRWIGYFIFWKLSNIALPCTEQTRTWLQSVPWGIDSFWQSYSTVQETPNRPNWESFFQKGIVGEGQTKPFQVHLYPEESFHIALFTEMHNWRKKKKNPNLISTHLETVRQALDVPI